MTVTNLYTTSDRYNGNGTTDEFSTQFHFALDEEVLVYKIDEATDVATLQSIGTHYTLEGAGTGDAGTVTFLEDFIPTSDEQVHIVRVSAKTQTTDYVNSTKFPANTHEAALDKLTRLLQEVDRDSSRSPRLPIYSLNYPVEFPDWSVSTSGYLLRINTDGDGLELVDPSDLLTGDATPTLNYFLVGDGSSWVSTSPTDSRTALGLGSIATQAASSVAITGGTITGITDLAIADGGTGSSTAAGARTNLGLVINTDVQAYDTELAAIAGLTSAADKAPYFTGSGTAALMDVSAFGRSLIDDAAASNARTTLGLGTLATQSGTFSGTSSGTNTGDQTITLTGDVTGTGTGTFAATIADDAVTYAKIQDVSATDKILGRSTAGAGNVEEITCTATGRSILDDASTSAVRTTLGLAIGTDVQAYDTELAALAGLTSAANKGITFTGSGTAGTYDLTAAALTVLDDATVAAMVDTLGGAATTGTGGIARKTSPQFTTPDLGVATATTINGATITSGTLDGSVTGTNTGDQLVFKTIVVAGQSDIVADTATDTLTLVAGSNVTITTNAGTDTITIASSGGGGGGLSDGDYGDITVSGSSTVLTIDNDVVTYAKMQDVSATDKLLGRSTAGAGDVEEISCTAAARTVLDDTTVAAMVDTLGGAATTGTGGLARATSPTFVTPILGVAAATTINKVTLTAPATGSTLTIAEGKTLTASNTLTLTGTDSSSVAFGAGGTVTYTSNTLAAFAATTSAELAGVISDETGSGALVFATTPTLVTPVLGVATATSINTATITAPTTTVGGNIKLLEGTNNGTNALTIQAPASTANVTATFQAVTGDVYVSSGTDVALADGGTGASLADPGADRIMFWDDSAGAVTWLTAGTNLTITGTTIDASGGAAATQAEQETGTSTTVFVTPGRQQFHNSAAKVWALWNTTTSTTLTASFNVASLTDVNSGRTGVNLTTAFSTANYAVVASNGNNSDAGWTTALGIPSSASTSSIIRVTSYDNTSYSDCLLNTVVAFGDQ